MEQQYKTDAEIYAVLEREIIDLTIRPGSSLSENPLCARFGAPRSLIRVVLQKLQENGLVRIVPYKGTTVTRLNRRIVDELIYERTAVEGRILRDFAPIATPAQRAQIRARVDAYEALAHVESPDFNKLYEADCRLHETCGNGIQRTLESLECKVRSSAPYVVCTCGAVVCRPFSCLTGVVFIGYLNGQVGVD